MKDMLDSFDHVVVVMLENRSFDNLLGHLYPQGVPADAPLGKTFNGVTGKDLSNPIPKDAPDIPPGTTSIPVGKTDDYHQPFPDPGEFYPHVNTQLFGEICGENQPPFNLPADQDVKMNGFVKDYIENFTVNEEKKAPSFDQYKQIMDCFDPCAIPVMKTLAEEFAVFDNWHCAVPSQTWCNRAFWNAGTSWGHVVNPGTKGIPDAKENTEKWVANSDTETVFNQLEEASKVSDLDWAIYTDTIVSLTGMIHYKALKGFHKVFGGKFHGMTKFEFDCKNGKLPAYSFVEPKFILDHNDMHPSSVSGLVDGKEPVGSVMLGEQFVWKIYDVIRNSKSETGSNSQNTLLIITFDEHGGCYDHVAPPSKITPPDLSKYKKWMDFGFDRLGVRVPMIMVSAHIAKNTVVNTSMHHNTFLKTMNEKWNRVADGCFKPLTARVPDGPLFTEVFTSREARPACDWPDIKKPQIPPEHHEIDFSGLPLNDLQNSIAVGAHQILGNSFDPEVDRLNMTAGELGELLKKASTKLQTDVL